MKEGKESIVTDIDLPSLEVSLRQKLQSTQTWESFEPFILPRLPCIIRETNRELYEPRVVSIGPYHRGKESLLGMEAHKQRCLIDFLKQNTKVSLEVYVKEIKALEARARKCYSESINMNEDEFTEMLLLDGCFMLEFFIKIRAREPHLLLDVGWGTKTIISDLLLFENQIPFFIIETLYYIVSSYEGDRENLLYLLNPSTPDLSGRGQIYHLLHLYYQYFLPSQISQTNSIPSISFPKSHKIYKSIPCATELYKDGIVFKKKINYAHMFDITFENGVMEIPTLSIDSVRKAFYMNLAAFEKNSSLIEHNLTSYMVLMGSLINSNKDVAFLQRCEIIDVFQNKEELAAFFNQIGDWGFLDSEKNYFKSLFIDVQGYCKSRWHKHRARLMHDYFNSPWSSLSVFAAILLLILSGLQTVFQIYPVVRTGHPS